ncbi:hypothetical protein QBC45DRAFT_414331 [Copromyces sp. CBS 386.78]|nr:hypothetical protein QBC45DRAFT_414331 [Copromyces sp. CBS 386.78]
MDYSQLRAAALQNGEDEEAVTVDTRALIDKVLARYSGEWTTLRELIQNAADAQATTVKIKWETIPSVSVPAPHTMDPSELLKHTLTHHTLRRLLVQNDGQPFANTDWARLKRIAEGNPDETKIGAFGVGFYSVFADCEEPFVSSGKEAMAFYWKGNALFTRKLQLPVEQHSRETAFVLDYRNTTTPLPNLLSVSQFLGTSLTFVSLQKIEFWIDDWRVLALQKKSSPSAQISIPRDLETRTKDGLMKLTAAEQTSTQIDASFMSVLGWKPKPAASSNKSAESAYTPEPSGLKGFFSRLTSSAAQTAQRTKAAKKEKEIQEAIAEDLTAVSTSTIFLRITAAQIATSVSSSFAAELERATKKSPPKTTRIALLTSSYDETVASEESTASNKAAKAIDIFASVLPSKKPGGRVFIGFPTTQTTGAGMHISAPSVIPTVEREAIDLNARWVRTWNIEMLRVAGIIARLGFVNDMSDLTDKLKRISSSNNSKKGSGYSPEDVQKFVPEALHILKTYSFEDSTPSAQVAKIIEEAFWTSYRKASIEVYSSQGVLQTNNVRLFSEDYAKFLSGIPIILKDMQAAPFIQKLIDYGLLEHITAEDVVKELGSKAMDKQQLHHFVVWLAKTAASGELKYHQIQHVLDVAVATVSDDGNGGEIIALGSIKNYLNNRIPATLPIPPTTIPVAFTANVPEVQLQSIGWEPLGIVPWLRFLIASGSSKDEEHDLTKSSKFSVQVLSVLSKNWENLNPSDKSSVVSALEHLTVIPTKLGMRKPRESFFSSVKLFHDLPTIEGCDKLKEKFLVALGVRKTLDLETIFTRLLNPAPAAEGEAGAKKWSHVELIKYLASVKNDIPAEDMKRLKQSKLCPAEDRTSSGGPESSKGTEKLYKLSELYEPKDSLRLLQLPTLHWPGIWKANSPEGAFVFSLGLRPYPAVPELIEMMASSDADTRKNSMAYFINNYQLNQYGTYNLSKIDNAILPLQGNEKKLVRPSACFTNPDAAILGYDILRRDLHDHASKFGVARDPSILECVGRLIANPPNDHQEAVRVFSYFTTRIAELGLSHVTKIRSSAIIPVTRRKASGEKGETKVVYITPPNCYLGTSSTYGDIFDFVDFGPNANVFLFKCGAKEEPTKPEIALMACSEPARLLSTLQSSEKYLNLLRSLADEIATLKKDKELFRKMTSSAWLLGSRDISNTKEEPDSGDYDAPIKQYQLASPQQITILDDIICYRLFKDSLLFAPEDDALEAFYAALGSEEISSKVSMEHRIGPAAEKQDIAATMRKLVIERSKIFLFEYSKYKKSSIKHDARWLEKNLQVKAVTSLALRRSLKGYNQQHTEKRSAAAVYRDGNWILYMSTHSRPDLYQVGQAICTMLLSRHGQQAYFFIEPFLKLDLLELRARGYNVDRILRAKAAEARIAEEERRKALEAEEQKIREREKDWAQQQVATTADNTVARAPQTPRQPDHPRMPGGFDDSPDHDPAPQPLKRFGDLFSGIKKQLGLEADDGSNRPPAQQPGTRAPEQLGSGSSGGVGGGSDSGTGSGSGGGTGTGGSNNDGRVTSPAVVQQNLLSAIKSTRAHDSSGVFSPPTQTEITEQSTYCDSTPATNMNFVAEAPGGMRVFLAKDVSVNPGQFLSSNIAGISKFETLLRDVANVYNLPAQSLHIYYDEQGPTIAFNKSGSIFCNFRFFSQLHLAKLTGAGGMGRAEATVWWWVTIAHELAHNLVSPHNSAHSYYTESFIQEYFGKMMAMTAMWATQSQTQSQASLPAPPPPPPGQQGTGVLGSIAGNPFHTAHSSLSSVAARGQQGQQGHQEPPPPYEDGNGRSLTGGQGQGHGNQGYRSLLD